MKTDFREQRFQLAKETLELARGDRRWLLTCSVHLGEPGHVELVGDDKNGLCQVQGGLDRGAGNTDQETTESQLIVIQTGHLRAKNQRCRGVGSLFLQSCRQL